MKKIDFVAGPMNGANKASYFLGRADGTLTEKPLKWAVYRRTTISGDPPAGGESRSVIALVFSEDHAKFIANMMNRETMVLDMISSGVIK